MRAVELFNEALDLNPSFLEAFERINKILTAQKDWKQLERAYRKMLHRVAGKGNTDLEYNLWHNLGLIYRDRLERHRTPRIEAFRMAARLKPDELRRAPDPRRALRGHRADRRAIDEHQADPRSSTRCSVDPYRALYRLYLEQKAVRSGVVHVPRRSPSCARPTRRSSSFFEDYRAEGMLQVKSRLDNEQWIQNLFHEEENLYVGKIFEMIAAAALIAKIQQLKAKKQLPVLDPRFKQDPATSTVTFAKTFGWAAQVLGVPCPELYVRNDVPGALVAVPIAPPASVAGQTRAHRLHAAGAHVHRRQAPRYYRGEHYIKTSSRRSPS